MGFGQAQSRTQVWVLYITVDTYLHEILIRSRYRSNMDLTQIWLIYLPSSSFR